MSTSTDSTKYFTLIERLVFIVIQEVYHHHRLYIDHHVHLHECHESGLKIRIGLRCLFINKSFTDFAVVLSIK